MSGCCGVIDPRTKPIIKAAKRLGWKIAERKTTVVIYPPDGSRPISVHRSNRDGRRGVPNALLQARKAGLPV